jgi:hypothetical protein
MTSTRSEAAPRRRFAPAALLAGLVATLPFWLALAVLLAPEGADPTLIVAGTAVAFALSVAEVGVAFVWIAGRAAIRFVRSPFAFGEATALSRLAGFVAGLALLPDVLGNGARAIATAIVSMIVQIPLSLLRLAGGAAIVEADGRLVGRTCLELVARLIAELGNLQQELAETASAPRLVLFLVAWVVVARAVQAASTERAASFVKAHPSLNASNVGFVLVLACGLFLSFAAILSLPRLRDTPSADPELAPDKLQETLMVRQTQREDLERSYFAGGPSQDENPFRDPVGVGTSAATAVAAPRTAVQQDWNVAVRAANSAAPPPDAGPGNPTTPALDQGLAQLVYRQERARLESKWRGAYLQWASLPEAVLVSQRRAVDEAVGKFRVDNVGARGSLEERKQFALIQGWFSEKVNADERRLSECSYHIRTARNEVVRWIRSVTEALGRGGALGWTGPSVDAAAVDPDIALGMAANVCAVSSVFPAPDRPRVGDSLGPLRYVAGWLLDAGSIALAAIVGMIGFGLLGSVISTFVRERLEASKGGLVPAHVAHAVVADLAGVVLRGLSAAVVVFLAAKGGLAVFSGPDTDVNPYVLLLTCFVAAVFSERLWAETYAYFAKKTEEGKAGKANAGVTEAGGNAAGAAGAAGGGAAQGDAPAGTQG